MSAPYPSSGPSEGTPPSSPDVDKALRGIRSLTGAQYEVFGPLGRDRGGEFVFLARDVVRDRLVALKRNTSDGDPDSRTSGLRVLDQLDSSVPPPAGSCPACQTPFANWDPSCSKCGADIAGGPEVPSLGSTSEHLLESIKQSVPGYQVLGSMPRAAGGRWVYFAR